MKLKRLNNKEKWYVYYIIFLFMIELMNKLFIFLELKSMPFLYPVYIAGEFFILTSLYAKKLGLTQYGFIPLSAVAGIFLISAPSLGFTIDNDYAKVISNIIIVCLSGYALVQEIKGSEAANRFLLVDACIFFYYSVSVFTFIVQHQLAALSQQNASLIWGINNLLSSVVYGALIYKFLRLKK
ncbi:hypothetical protein [Chryseobacterium defluvii]|nr:hypothetical protein [Chryseobacterium defluvii]